MNEIELGRRLARRLDACTEDLEPHVLRRLATAREGALARLREPAAAATLHPSGLMAWMFGHPHSRSLRLALPAAVLAIGLTSVFVWDRPGAGLPEGEELALLGDELPINAYLDKGFQQWISPAMQR